MMSEHHLFHSLRRVASPILPKILNAVFLKKNFSIMVEIMAVASKIHFIREVHMAFVIMIAILFLL